MKTRSDYMNSQQLECFIYVAERLNFTKAAQALYLSVPTVTHHIKSLEEELGAKLFYRTSRVVKLTEDGQKFYYRAKDIFDRMNEAALQIQNRTESERVVFTIGCFNEREFKRLESALKEFRKKYPNVKPRIVTDDYFTLKNLYENQQLDFVICTSGLCEDGRFEVLETLSTFALVNDEHRLSQRDEIDFRDIADETLIVISPRWVNFRKGNRFQELLTLHSQDHEHIVAENTQESILLAKCGYGVSLLPEFLISSRENIRLIPLVGTKNIDYGIYYRPDNRLARAFVNEYKSAKRK